MHSCNEPGCEQCSVQPTESIRVGLVHIGREPYLCDNQGVGYNQDGLEVIAKRSNAFEPGGLVEEAIEELKRCKHHPACGGCEKLIARLRKLCGEG